MQGPNYFRRIFKVYFTRDKGYLAFWHERPAVSENISPQSLKGFYYMTFSDKARYGGPKDEGGVILFDYYFDIGRQYNPLAVAQYGLGHWNLFLKTGEEKYLKTAKVQAEWLLSHLEKEGEDMWVWKHHFPWHYKHPLASGWYSAHSQGTGISLLGRMFAYTGDERYKDGAKKAFTVFDRAIGEGGVKYTDTSGGVWLEEYRVNPPTHILNGYLWALWGVWDFHVLTNNIRAKELFDECIHTLEKHMPRFDLGFWSRYDLSHQALAMIASPFYHSLHIVQLEATALISGSAIFSDYAKRFARYAKNPFFKTIAVAYKAVFKLFYF